MARRRRPDRAAAPDRPRRRAATAAACAAVLAVIAARPPGAVAAATPAAPPAATLRATPAAPTPIALAAYHERVATAAALARTPRAAATVAALAGAPAAVRLPDAPGGAAAREGGATAPAAGAPAGDRIVAAEALAPPGATPDARRLAVVRDELAAVLEAGGPASGPDAAARAAALRRVLAGDAFRDRRSPWQRAWAWLAEQAERLWGDRQLPAGAGPTALRLGQLLAWLVVLAVAAATAMWLGRFVASLTAADRLDGAASAPATPAAARARAEAHAAAGDHRAAVRQLYLAALLVLEAHGLLPADRSRTNREQLAALAGGDALRRQMAAVVDTFDRVWYGVAVPDAAAFRAYAADVERLEALARAARGGGAHVSGAGA